MRRVAGQRDAPPAVVPGYGLPVGDAVHVYMSALGDPLIGGFDGICKLGGFGLDCCQQGIV